MANFKISPSKYLISFLYHTLYNHIENFEIFLMKFISGRIEWKIWERIIFLHYK